MSASRRPIDVAGESTLLTPIACNRSLEVTWSPPPGLRELLRDLSECHEPGLPVGVPPLPRRGHLHPGPSPPSSLSASQASGAAAWGRPVGAPGPAGHWVEASACAETPDRARLRERHAALEAAAREEILELRARLHEARAMLASSCAEKLVASSIGSRAAIGQGLLKRQGSQLGLAWGLLRLQLRHQGRRTQARCLRLWHAVAERGAEARHLSRGVQRLTLETEVGWRARLLQSRCWRTWAGFARGAAEADGPRRADCGLRQTRGAHGASADAASSRAVGIPSHCSGCRDQARRARLRVERKVLCHVLYVLHL